MSDRDLERFRALEESLLRPDVRASREQLDALIDDDFVEYGVSGRFFGKAAVLDAADRLPTVLLPLSDLAVRVLTANAALVTYRSTTVDPDGTTNDALRSSIWVRADGHWRIAFHQGTPAAR